LTPFIQEFTITLLVFTARSELREVLFLALSVTFLFVYEISREPLNGFAPNSQGRLSSTQINFINEKVKTTTDIVVKINTN